jgi:NAD(P)-dependent dehydrogenase (short-subunit alcohol dehydrogenase family)
MKSLRELANLSGRVAVVTGGAGHIGASICDTLAELGANIAIVDISEKSLINASSRIERDYSIETLPLAVDLTCEGSVKSIPQKVINNFDRLDILINCAALVGSSELKGWVSPFKEQSSKAWRLALEVNLTAPFILTQACSNALKESGCGSVINIGSIYGLVGPDIRLYDETNLGNPAAYAASKGGLLQLTRWLATILAPHIRVNSITPGGIWRNQPEVFLKRYNDRTPLKRMGKEEDIKGAIAYLASDLSSYVTGHNLVIDGGWTIW